MDVQVKSANWGAVSKRGKRLIQLKDGHMYVDIDK